VIWDPAPAGCTFNLKASGDQDKFNVVSTVRKDNASQTPIRHNEITNGYVSAQIAAGESWLYKPSLGLFSDTKEPVVLEASLRNPNGSIVTIPDDSGQMKEARCEWETDDDTTPIRVKISVGVPAAAIAPADANGETV
jgi:hypothetical protein